VHLSLKIWPLVATILMIFSELHHQVLSLGGTTTLAGGTAISGGGTRDRGCGMQFWLNLITG